VTNLATKFEHPMPIRSWFMSFNVSLWLTLRIHTWPLRMRRIPDPDLLSHYTTFIGLRQRLIVVYYRAVPCKPFSGHLAAILFCANCKVKTQNSAWKPGSSHSACLNYVKKTGSPFLPQNAPWWLLEAFFSEIRLVFHFQESFHTAFLMLHWFILHC